MSTVKNLVGLQRIKPVVKHSTQVQVPPLFSKPLVVTGRVCVCVCAGAGGWGEGGGGAALALLCIPVPVCFVPGNLLCSIECKSFVL